MAIAWATVETAIQNWVETASGLADNKVIWADQDGGRQATPYMTIRMGDLVAVGTGDEVEQIFDEEADAGEEIEHRIHGQRELHVTVQAFGPVVGASSARALLSKVQAALSLPSVRETLRAAGLTAFDAGKIQNISALLGADFEGRAVLDVRFYIAESVSEFTTYIEHVEVTDTSTDETFTISSTE